MRQRAGLAWRSPPRFSRCRVIFPPLAGMGLAPQSAAKDRSECRWWGLSPAVSSRVLARSGPTPWMGLGAAARGPGVRRQADLEDDQLAGRPAGPGGTNGAGVHFARAAPPLAALAYAVTHLPVVLGGPLLEPRRPTLGHDPPRPRADLPRPGAAASGWCGAAGRRRGRRRDLGAGRPGPAVLGGADARGDLPGRGRGPRARWPAVGTGAGAGLLGWGGGPVVHRSPARGLHRRGRRGAGRRRGACRAAAAGRGGREPGGHRGDRAWS